MEGQQIEPEWFDNPEEKDGVEIRNDQLPNEFSEAFGLIREWGIDTIEGYGCCGGCTSGSFDQNPGAYYHSQDINAEMGYYDDGYGESHLEFHYNMPTSVYIGYCTPDGEGAGFVGEVVESAFKHMGFEVEWNGSKDKRIEVKL